MPTKDNDFKWVEARNNCSMAKAFEALKQTVEANVKEREEQLGGGSRQSPRLGAGDAHSFMVTRHSPFKAVGFRLQGDHILIEDSSNGNPLFDLTVVLNDDGECRFKVAVEGEPPDEREFFRWPVARKALEVNRPGLSGESFSCVVRLYSSDWDDFFSGKAQGRGQTTISIPRPVPR